MKIIGLEPPPISLHYERRIKPKVIKEKEEKREMKDVKKVPVKIILLNENAVVPVYQTDGSAGFDFHSTEEVAIEPYATAMVPTGLAMAIEPGYEVQVRPRSGLSFKTPLRVANAPGTIDSDYRGEIKVLLTNTSGVGIFVEKGERVAQGVLSQVPQAIFEVVDSLDETERGAGGFGHTGSK